MDGAVSPDAPVVEARVTASIRIQARDVPTVGRSKTTAQQHLSIGLNSKSVDGTSTTSTPPRGGKAQIQSAICENAGNAFARSGGKAVELSANNHPTTVTVRRTPSSRARNWRQPVRDGTTSRDRAVAERSGIPSDTLAWRMSREPRPAACAQRFVELSEAADMQPRAEVVAPSTDDIELVIDERVRLHAGRAADVDRVAELVQALRSC